MKNDSKKSNAFIRESVSKARDRVKDRARFAQAKSLEELDRLVKNGVKLRPNREFIEDALYAYKSYAMDSLEQGKKVITFQKFIIAHAENSLWGGSAENV